MNARTYRKGFGVLEVLIVVGLVALVIPSMFQFSFFMTATLNRRIRTVEAAYLTQEGLEAVRTIRDRGWIIEVAPLANISSYYPVIVSNSWTLTSTDPGALNGLYTRSIVFSAVNRDASDNIVATGGSSDTNTRLVTATVTWPDRGVTQSVSLATYITNFQDN